MGVGGTAPRALRVLVWGSGFEMLSGLGLRVQGRRFFAEGVVDHASFVAQNIQNIA